MLCLKRFVSQSLHLYFCFKSGHISPARSKAASVQNSEHDDQSISMADEDINTGMKITPPVKNRSRSRSCSVDRKEKKSSGSKGRGDEISMFASTLTTTISSLGDMVTDKKKQQPVADVPPPNTVLDDAEDLWARCLAVKVRMMSKISALEFKVKVDTLALEHIKQDNC